MKETAYCSLNQLKVRSLKHMVVKLHCSVTTSQMFSKLWVTKPKLPFQHVYLKHTSVSTYIGDNSCLINGIIMHPSISASGGFV